MEAFKRAFRLKIQLKDIIKVYQELGFTEQSLKIEFSISCGVNGAFSNGNITVYGLSNDDMQYLTSLYNPINNTFKQNFVSLEVGYIEGLSLILKGNIIDIDPNYNILGNSINLKVQSGVGNNLSNNSITSSVAGATNLKVIAGEVAKNNGLTLKFDSKLQNKTIDDYSFQGTPFQQIQNLRTYFNDIDIFIDDVKEVLNVLKKNGGEVINKNELSNKTGLLEKPKPTARGVEILSLLNTNFKAGGFIKLKNENLKSMDGVYRILELSHQGSNYGKSWYSKILAQRIN